MSSRKRIALWCYRHPAAATLIMYLVIAIPATVGAVLAVSPNGRAMAVILVAPAPVIPAAIAFGEWRRGVPQDRGPANR